ncbi:MAG: TAXI family TRAP transporter solute-binding subunit [Burkholderiales bacterium]|nr:MAG: TAXI family TRAP transporter solute-binding subunit [Burkholderiales bacterium]
MRPVLRTAAAGALALGICAGAFAAEKIKMATIAPGSSAYLVMTTMASLVNQAQKDYELSVDATGAATKHMIEMARGQLDMVMVSPTIYAFMKNGTAMYKKLAAAPELSKNIALVYWFPYGAYHTIVYADSGIEKLEDIRGKRVFLGPPGGGAWNAAMQWIKATTGMEPGKDFENVKAGWSAALQGFQDRQFDVYVTGGIPPYPQVEQLALTSKLRIIGLSKSQVDAATPAQLAPTRVQGRQLDRIPAGIYGDGVVNKEDVYTLGSVVGVGARLDLSEETVYRITKAFWESLPDAAEKATYMKRVTKEYAVREGGLPLHPGAARYYREIGLDIPAGSMPRS